MKILNKLIPAGILAGSLLVSACAVPAYESTTTTTNTADTSLTARSAVTIENLSTSLSSDFIRGFDASQVDYLESTGVKFYDTDRVEKDVFEILKNHGVNTIRLRLWVNPEKITTDVVSDEDAIPKGDNNYARTARMAKRVKDAGLKFMLDFHYSDTWADPGRQFVPIAWEELSSAEAVANAIYSYTYEVMTNLKAQGTTPDYVQIGNEINSGILLTKKDGTSFGYAGTVGKANFAKYIDYASKAVRAASSSSKIVIHVASSKTTSPTGLLTQLKNYERDDGTKSVDYDIIGLSYYPDLSSHGTIATMKQNVSDWAAAYDKQVIIAETTYDWNYSSTDTKASHSGNATAISKCAETKLGAAYTNLTSVISDFTADEIVTIGDSTCIKGSPETQAKVVRHVIEEAAKGGAIGVFSWGGEVADWHSFTSWEASGKYEFLPSIEVMNVKGN